jgi:hypothetical protein
VAPLLEDFAELSTARKMADWLWQQNAAEEEDGEASEPAQPGRELTAP